MKKITKICAVLTVLFLLSSTPVFAAGSKVNKVGTAKQELSYSCGAAAARNSVAGYYLPARSMAWGFEDQFRVKLATSTGGTEFNATRWQNTLNAAAPGNNYTLKWGGGWSGTTMAYYVNQTLNKAKNYNVIANPNHAATNYSNQYIHPYYAGKKVAHYVVIYGYNDNTRQFYISDSNYNHNYRTYSCSYEQAAWATKTQGIIY
ncbi:MAG: BtrH N-terminal domain-containing protein [Peptococcaceae bacterium]|nr:BtrH N-terminal domain-containing protein [Peptococcaceae bacterium]